MLYDYTSTTAADVVEVTEKGIVEANALIEGVVAEEGARTVENTLLPLDEASAIVSIAYGRGAFMARVHTDEAVRKAGSSAEERLNKWGIEVVFRADLYQALRELADADPVTTPEQRRLMDFWLRDFHRAGHDLEPERQAELKELKERLVELEVAFQSNVDGYKDWIDVTIDELDGLPQTYIDALSPGEAEDTLRVTLDYPELFPYLQNATNRRRREELWRKRSTSAVAENRPLLEEAIDIRRDVARLLDYPSWAHHRMEVKMATPDRVATFYDSLVPRLQEKVIPEHEKMQQMLEAESGDETLQQWDITYLTTRITREEFGVDQYEIANYFPLERVLDGMFELTSQMFGVSYTRVEEVNAWHPDVYLYQISDSETGEHLAYFYMDLFPRDSKYGHAAAFDLVPGYRHASGEYVRPVAAMVANFTKPAADAPSLLRHEEVLTLFHEFGHILHQCLTQAESARFSGANTEWDFVEAPSQIMEHWTWEAEVLQRFARHHATGENIPSDLVSHLVAARDVNVASSTLRQAYFGVIDLSVHDDSETWDLEALDREAYDVTGLPYPEGTFFLASFGHIMGGYDAGYYGYLWSKVFGDDMYSRFQDEGVLNEKVGSEYRRVILEQGGSKDADQLLQEFLGREPNNEAFLRNLGIDRQ